MTDNSLTGKIMINKERRKRVMQRSMKVGHCVCDPKKPCPCDLFKEKNICLCAGERLDTPTGPVRLTQLVEKAGCASKIDQAFLKQVLNDVPASDDPRVIVGVPAGDDAGIYDIGNGKALVQTVDVFTPSVDDPYQFGQVAAANSLSDIYAMGGSPCTALSVLGFPVRQVPDQVMSDILRGGIDKMHEAGVAVIGGHSINDAEIKAGFAVTGFIDKDKIITNAGAKVGDVLILTKPLGTGIVAFAHQIDRASSESVEAAACSMTTLNKTASELMVKYQAHAGTDVTGFSLMGHLTEMMLRSGAEAEIIWDDIPLFPGVLQYVADGILPGAIERNKESCGHLVTSDNNVSELMVDMCFDAQTSGGLLIAVAPDNTDKLLKALHDNGISAAAIIGKVSAKGNGRVNLKTKGTRMIPKERENSKSATPPQSAAKEACCSGSQAASQLSSCCNSAPASSQPTQTESTCCSSAIAPGKEPHTDIDAQTQFSSFLAGVNRPGGLDACTKEAINLALSIATQCESCLKIHIQKARKMGFSAEEIDEAAWLAIAFGGAPAMMFYKTVKIAVDQTAENPSTDEPPCCR